MAKRNPEEVLQGSVHEEPRDAAARTTGSVRSFCDQIHKDAQEEIERILGKAELAARRKTEEADDEAAKVARKMTDAAESQARSIEAKTLSGVSLEVKRTILRTQGEIMDEVFRRVREKLEKLRGTKEYSDFLKRLSLQGMLVLEEDECVLAPGAEDRELFTQQLTRRIEQSVGQITGRKARVTVSQDLGPEGLGVRVYSAKRTVLFDNTLDARMERLADELKAIVAREVFSSDGAPVGEDNADAEPGHR